MYFFSSPALSGLLPGQRWVTLNGEGVFYLSYPVLSQPEAMNPREVRGPTQSCQWSKQSLGKSEWAYLTLAAHSVQHMVTHIKTLVKNIGSWVEPCFKPLISGSPALWATPHHLGSTGQKQSYRLGKKLIPAAFLRYWLE